MTVPKVSENRRAQVSAKSVVSVRAGALSLPFCHAPLHTRPSKRSSLILSPRSIPNHRKVNLGCRLHLGLFVPAVIARRSHGRSVAHEFLHRHQINPSVQHLPGKSPAQIVRSEGLDLGLAEPLFQNDPDRLIRQALRYDLAALPDSEKQRPGSVTPEVNPSVYGGLCSITQIDRAGLVALGSENLQATSCADLIIIN